ncbi:hypothetical protein EDC96DRAFT_451172 [Choanephora cucurbitarum]|nr:hypothetical protein EDC96DRAFT_453579 [Choanephora cucurbitarum]KAI8333481.1 hypothetical protein EDC96DRAFT_451172 [Choanephora cucurbitarum]
MLTPISILITIFLLAMPVHSYCIYNKVQAEGVNYRIRQTPGNAGLNYFARFSRSELKPGESACCPWTVKDCVKSGGQNDVVTVAYRCMQGGMIGKPSVVDVPGGGWIEIHGDWRHELVKSFNPDGSPFEGNPRVDLQAGEN